MDTNTDILIIAARCYRARQDRKEHPDGVFDNAGRWTPEESERQECCKAIRRPTRSYPYSLMLHCRTVAHVAALHVVAPEDLRRVLRDGSDDGAIPARRREGGEQYYKLVAQLPDGRLVSVFDGRTEYRLNEELKQTARTNHGGGFYVYRNPEDARNAAFPHGAVLDASSVTTVLLRVRAEGSYCVYDSGKIAFSRVTPLEVLRRPSKRTQS